MSFCCPADSWVALKSDHKPRHLMVEIPNSQGLQAYWAVPVSPRPTRAIVMSPDVFGIPSGRTRAIADQLAEEGYLAVIPDVFRGAAISQDAQNLMAMIPDWAKLFPLEKMRTEFRYVIKHLVSLGVQQVGLFGFCWGAWAAMAVLGDPESIGVVRAFVGCHPSLQLESWIFSRSPESMVDAFAPGASKTAVLFLPAGNDPEFVREGGAVIVAMKQKGLRADAVTFPEALHGWVIRGDASKPEVHRDVERALTMSVNFFAETMPVA